MLNLKNLMCAALAATLFFSASEAEARFGKSSSSSDSDKKEEKKEKKESKHEDRDNSSSSRAVHDASPVRVHDASPVGSSRPNPPPPPPPPERYEHHEHHERVIVVEPEPTYYVEPEQTYYVEPAPPPQVYVEPPPSSPPAEIINRKSTLFSPMRMGIEGGFVAGGGSRGTAFLAIEGEQMGVDGRISGLTLPTDDGSAGTDEIGVAEVHLTWAAVAQERMRLRMEAGFSYAGAPELKVYAPSLGVSFDGRLAPSLDVEARVQVTPFPYHQVDAQAALAVKLYPFALRAGWRTLFMDDAGLVDGESHQDLFSGPYLGLGLNF